MNPQGFSFPPPPPPPPTQQHQPHQQQQQQQQQYPHNTAFAPYGQGHYGQRGNRGGGAGHFRGRGRGYGGRGGGGRGGHLMPSDANRPSAYPTNTPVGYGPVSYPGYSNQPIPSQQPGLSPPHFTSSQAPNFQNTPNRTSFASPRPFPQPSAVHGPPFQHQGSYDTSYATVNPQQAPVYAQVVPPHQHASLSVQPTMMGPPIRWGFEKAVPSASFGGQQRPNQRGPRQYNNHTHQGSTVDRQAKHANKRDHSSAFGKPQSITPRIPAPPPVPSFGNPLPSKPPPSADSLRKPKKKKRKHNQLGLTPKAEEHESSEEEDDDADEESRLAAGNTGPDAPLHVTYRGRTSTLQTSAEIAAWIEERKKRFPTQAKVEERKKAMEEAKKAREEAQRQREARKQAVKQEKKVQEKPHRDHHGDSLDPADAAAKAKRKADKLRRKLMKEEKRIAEAEADVERARLRLEESQTPSADACPGAAAQEVETQREQNLVGNDDGAAIAKTKPDNLASSGTYDEQAAAESSSQSSDWTSSSGSDLSSSDSDESGDDDESAPEQATSRRDGPERVPAPSRENKKQVCRQFARTGRCARGSKCKFLHETPDRGVKKKKPIEQKGRKGLLQALLARQKEEENRKTMEMIVWMGENGLLDEPATQNDASGQSTTAENTDIPHTRNNGDEELRDGAARVQEEASASVATG